MFIYFHLFAFIYVKVYYYRGEFIYPLLLIYKGNLIASNILDKLNLYSLSIDVYLFVKLYLDKCFYISYMYFIHMN